ncbi:MAG: hypothetical protein JO355_01335 [Planctomycetaceae bacterium]|nr:hypothetical protein [Planctomycetaceae bacterium]MBV8675793.1 hypothetical protein [Planctomycetaceae bacterium]
MTSETLQNAIRTQPFRPFVVHMADGREILVAHPELIAHKAGTRTAVVVSGDSFEFIDLLLATGLRDQNIEEMPATDRSRGGS